MAAIIDGFKKFANIVVEGIGGDAPFTELVDEDPDGYPYGYGEDGEGTDGYHYTTDGNAVRITEPDYEPVEKRPERKVIGQDRFNHVGGNEIMTIEPRSFEDAATIVKHLKDRKIVMLNLHLLDKEQSQRTIDFVCGASHALNGAQKKVGDVFVFAPSNVTLSQDVQPQQSKFNDSLWSTSLQ